MKKFLAVVLFRAALDFFWLYAKLTGDVKTESFSRKLKERVKG